MSKKKKIYSPDFKVKVVLELLSGQHSLNELVQLKIASHTEGK